MRYSDAIAAAPPGSDHFRPEDLTRLRASTLAFVLSPGPAAPPLEEVAAALQGSPLALRAVAEALPDGRGERLLRLGQRPRDADGRAAARQGLVRGLFWPLVYELLPERWDQLSRAEPVHPRLLEALGGGWDLAVEVGAGSGRLSQALTTRCRHLVAVEPALPLARILAGRLGPGVRVVGGRAPGLPIRSQAADLVVSCSTFGPDAPTGGDAVLSDLERCARPGGTVALVGPEDPLWFEAQGYRRLVFDPAEVSIADDPELVRFFGPLTPPHELLLKTV